MCITACVHVRARVAAAMMERADALDDASCDWSEPTPPLPLCGILNMYRPSRSRGLGFLVLAVSAECFCSTFGAILHVYDSVMFTPWREHGQ